MSLFPGVAFITGAGSGIGRQTAISFAAEGCLKIAIADRDPIALDAAKAAIQQVAPAAEVVIAPMDVRLEQDVTGAVKATVDKFGRLDYAVNCAGVYGPNVPSTEVEPSEFDNVMAINYRGLWLCSREETKQMQTQEPLPTHDGRPASRGAIVNIASSLAIIPAPGKTPYASSKAAVIQMTKADAVDCASLNIRVNCVVPGITDTPFTSDIMDDGPAVLGTPIRRKASTQEIADVVIFLASPKASFMQGSVVVADGGHTIT